MPGGDQGLQAKPAKTKAKAKSSCKAPGGKKQPGPRLPGMKGGTVVADVPEARPYESKEPYFPLQRKKVMKLCKKQRLPLIYGGKVLALMDIMLAKQCTMNHLHDLSGVSYASIYNFFKLKGRPRVPAIERMVISLGYEDLEFAWIAHGHMKDYIKEINAE